MRVLRNILLMVGLILTTSFMPTSVPSEEPITLTVQKYDTQPYITWRRSGSGYWTQYTNYYVYNDFDWMVSRSVGTINGYYYYDFWFYSQSYYWDGYSASYTSTNLRNVNVYVDGKHYSSDYSSLGITFNQTYNAIGLRIMSKNPRPSISITWGQMKAK
jgi:hypothetical protein